MSSLDDMVAHLARLLKAHLHKKILQVLRDRREPLTAWDIAAEMGVSVRPIRQALSDLVAQDKVAVTHFDVPTLRYRPVEIGICEWCGLLDHHLVAGECRACAASVGPDTRPAQARRVC